MPRFLLMEFDSFSNFGLGMCLLQGIEFYFQFLRLLKRVTSINSAHTINYLQATQKIQSHEDYPVDYSSLTILQD